MPNTPIQMMSGSFSNLEELSVSHNWLVRLPDRIGELKKLQRLDLSGNKLDFLPESLGELGALRRLDLVNNELPTLPESLRNLTSLKELYLHENRITDLPPELLGPPADVVRLEEALPAGPQEILEYYFRVRGGWRPLNEAKLILVGRGAVGKTSIVNRVVHNIFRDEGKTEGIKITEWTLPIRDEEVRLNLWDFGGQEIMHATHQFFLTQRSLYLVVLNGREGGEDADAEYWLKLIESFGGTSPVIVVLNKIGEHPFDLNRRALQQKYPVIRDFIKMDCKDGRGTKQLRKVIERETDRLEHLRDPFPSSWFAIKSNLSQRKKNFLSFEDYSRLCARLGEKNHHSQETLAFYLHSLGVALNFREDPRLRDTHVLSPRWVTHGIYKILNSKRLADEGGVIKLGDASEILDLRKYPEPMHRFLFDLMKKFELCFSFPEEETRYLIPQLLDKQEPKDTEQFVIEQGLNFRYDYPVLPEGLLPRFIVRTHVLSEGLPRWRSGVIVAFEGCRALVKADVQDKKVLISVSGPPSSRRRLLAVIRSDFERIHRDIRSLQPEEMVPLPSSPNVVVPYEELLVMERQEITQFPKVIGQRVSNVNVDELLNGVDLKGVRLSMTRLARIALGESGRKPVRLFYSYSHKDERLRNQLETHLKLLNRRRLIEVWHDRKIEAGDDWKQKIDENLERADIILLLISADFIASDYCYEKEMKRALELHETNSARVIPVIIRDVNWKKSPFADLEALPKGGKAVTKWSNKDSAWRSVSEGIERIVEAMSVPDYKYFA